jgi:hypothetical protein
VRVFCLFVCVVFENDLQHEIARSSEHGALFRDCANQGRGGTEQEAGSRQEQGCVVVQNKCCFVVNVVLGDVEARRGGGDGR